MDIEWLEQARSGDVVGREFTAWRAERLLSGVLWQTLEPNPGAPLVCLGHGASGDRHQLPIPYLAKRLVREHGYSCLAIDGPVHGRRTVGDGGRGAFADEYKKPEVLTEMTADWIAAIDLVSVLPEVETRTLGYWGLSMGTIFGLPLVAVEPRIKVATLGLMGVFGSGAMRERILQDAANITCPVFFIMQLEDELFSRESSLALFDALASVDKRIHANSGLHPQVPGEELDYSVSFLATYLKGGRMSRRRADVSA